MNVRDWLAACTFAWLLGSAALAQPAEPELTTCNDPGPAGCGSGRPPQIWLDPALGKLQPIRLDSVAIDIRLQGFLASTTIDLVFHNPNDRVLEGEFVFPLAAGQSITGYALEVEGKLRQGVVVEKETARVAFEQVTRQGIDPGLAELTRGNVFRTRLYPIPARGSKRVALSFDQPLLDAGSAWRYVLPLRFEQPVARFAVQAEAIHAEVAPRAEAAGALTFESWRNGFRAELEQHDVTPQRELVFSVPKPAAPLTAFRVPDRLEPAWSTFAAQLDSGLPTTLPSSPPKRIALFYDASGSAAQRDREREIDVLEAWLGTLGPVEVQLVAFRNDADPARTFKLGSGTAALAQAMRELPLDGGSSYGAIDLALVEAPDLVLVVGDGISNFGSHQPRLQATGGKVPRLALLHAAQAADHARLQRWAARFGGQVLNLLELEQSAAVARLALAQWQLQAVSVRSGECTELAPAAPTPVGTSFSLYGRCKGAAELELRFGGAGAEPVLRTLKLAAAAEVEPERGGFVGRLWATARIVDLENADRPDATAIVELAKRHGVVTARTSMLVLDRIEDYVRYRVEPAEAELRTQYLALLGQQAKQPTGPQVDQAHLDTVLAQWRTFRDWHAQRHPWLETVLAPTAQAELARWHMIRQQPQMAGLAKRLPELEQLAGRSDALQRRWLKDGAQDASRLAWEAEARTLMLQLDALRIARLDAWPESDQFVPATTNGPTSSDRDQAGMALPAARAAPVPEAAFVVGEAEEEVAMSAPPPPPRPMSEAGGDDLEEMIVTGSRIEPNAEPADEAKALAGTAPAPPKPTEARIELQDWNPDTPYLAKLRAATDPYAAYLRERALQAATPAFYLDCAEFFRSEAKDARLALRVLSNLAELDYESAPLLRVLAYRLGHWQHFELAVPLFEEVLALRGEEPQSRRDLALALSRQPQPDWERAVRLLWEVVSRSWDGRFPEVQVIALHELNDVLARMPADAAALDLAAIGILPPFVEPVEVDLRVVLSWDADNTDIDLWVIDPSGETAIYSHPQTRTGGQVSRDFTGGYGPEVFTIRRALPGTYVVKAHYYGDGVQKLTGAVTVQAEFLTHFNSDRAARQAVTRRLEGDEDVIEIGRFVAE